MSNYIQTIHTNSIQWWVALASQPLWKFKNSRNRADSMQEPVKCVHICGKREEKSGQFSIIIFSLNSWQMVSHQTSNQKQKKKTEQEKHKSNKFLFAFPFFCFFNFVLFTIDFSRCASILCSYFHSFLLFYFSVSSLPSFHSNSI